MNLSLYSQEIVSQIPYKYSLNQLNTHFEISENQIFIKSVKYSLQHFGESNIQRIKL
jgi:hypothetical protein